MAAVACINAIVGGVAVALALRWLLAASVPVARRPAHWWPWAWPPLCFGYQVRRFHGAAALVLEL